jgi:hypothetical protein
MNKNKRKLTIMTAQKMEMFIRSLDRGELRNMEPLKRIAQTRLRCMSMVNLTLLIEPHFTALPVPVERFKEVSKGL